MTPGTPQKIDFLAGILALVFPGAGHFLRKQRRRGGYAALGVFGLFLTGLFIGGIDVIDREEDKWWFYGQALVGPIAIVTNNIHQNRFKAYEVPPNALLDGSIIDQSRFEQIQRRSLNPGEARRIVTVSIRSHSGQTTQRELPVIIPAQDGDERPNIKSLGRMNELGMLSATIAGMLNFIIILDALFPGRARTTGAST